MRQRDVNRPGARRRHQLRLLPRRNFTADRAGRRQDRDAGSRERGSKLTRASAFSLKESVCGIGITGLYLGTIIAAASALLRERAAALVPALLAIFILGAGGLGFVGLNKLRFDSFTKSQGTFEKSPSTYGVVYLGHEAFDTPRAKAITEHGLLNAKRILPNGVVYAFDPPWLFARASSYALKMFRAATTPELGYIRVGNPRIGIIFLWMGWCALAVMGLFFGTANRRLWVVLVATATGAVVTLSFYDITLRGSFDLWPLVAVLALSGLYLVVPRIAAAPLRTATSLALIGTIAAGLIFTAATVVKYRDKFQEKPNSFFAPWTVKRCRNILVTYPRLSEERARALCEPPNDRQAPDAR